MATFDEIVDPWEYLNNVRALDLAARPYHLDPWLERVNARPRAEQDALLAEGRAVWNYRMETVRAQIKQLQAKDAGEITIAPTVHNIMDPEAEGFMAEIIYNPKLPHPFSYLVHRFDAPDAPPEIVENIKVGRRTYSPPISDLIERRAVMVPSDLEEYGHEENLFHELECFIDKYLKVDEDFRRLLCCYVLLTWVYDRFTVIPYLRVLGDFGSGKTRLLQTVGWLCYRPAAAGGAATPASLFRMIDRYRGTVVLDEADFNDKSDEWQEIVKILNVGNQRWFPIWRIERNGNDGHFGERVFDCYGPKILATRRSYADTALESRCFSHIMQAAESEELKRLSIPSALPMAFIVEAAKLRNKLLLWRLRVWPGMEIDYTQWIEGVEPRVNQIIQPLLAIGNEQLQRIVMDAAWKYVDRLKQERRDSFEGIVAAAALQHWLRAGRPESFLMKAITNLVRERGFQTVSDKRIGSTLTILGIQKEARGGLAHARMTEGAARGLCKKFGLRLEDYELAVGGSGLPQLPAPGGDA